MNAYRFTISFVVAMCAVFLLSTTRRAMTEQNHGAAPPNTGNFSVLKGEIDGYPILATIDMSLRDYKEKANVPWFLSISTPLIKPTSDGLPTPQDAGQLNKWEDALEKHIAAETRFIWVGHVTWKGHREQIGRAHV